MANEPSNLAALFADVSGSTRLYETVGDTDALATIGRCLTLVGAACEGHGGRVVKTIGDEVMAVFGSADQAATAAAEMQARISELPPVGKIRLAIRVGFHVGPAIERDGDVFGDSVNVAARMVALAKGEQVILSSDTANALSPMLRDRVREIDLLTVKGKAQDIRIFELIWQSSEADLTSLSTRPIRHVARISVHHGARVIELGEGRSTLTLGRDQQNDVVIGDKMASRMHARIERRRDKFVLVDQSSNGTYVGIDGEPEIQLRREEMILRGRGRVSFGHAHSGESDEVLTFSCLD
ncbi:MAG: adenylate/guanylate cyclase domain-containing protein [Betaproteobacteria bacterium]